MSHHSFLCHRLFVLIFGLWVLTVSASANPMTARNDNTNVTSEPQASSQVVATLRAGDQVQTIARRGMFWQVRTADGQEGFVAVTSLQRMSGNASNISQAIRQAAVENRDEADDITTNRMRTSVMGVRGLDEDESTAAAGDVRPNMRMVYRMEDRWVEMQRLRSLEQHLHTEVEQRMNMRYGH